MKKYMTIKGMSCAGCENRVKNALGALDFVRLVEADAKKGCAIVKMPIEVPDEVLKEAVNKLGYTVTSVERLLCGCKNIREVDIKRLIESGTDTPEGILEASGLGSYGCCSKDIVPLLIDKYKNGKDIDINAAVFALNKKNDYIIAVNDMKNQLALRTGRDTDSKAAEGSHDCH